MNRNRRRMKVAKKFLPIALAAALTVSGAGIPVHAQDIAGGGTGNRHILRESMVVAEASTTKVEFGTKKINDAEVSDLASEINKIEITKDGYKLNGVDKLYQNTDGVYEFTTGGISKDVTVVIESDTEKTFEIKLNNFHAKAGTENQKVFEIKGKASVNFKLSEKDSSVSAKASDTASITGDTTGNLDFYGDKALYLSDTNIKLDNGAILVGKDSKPSIYSNKPVAAKNVVIMGGVVASTELGSGTGALELNGDAVVYCNEVKAKDVKNKKGVVYEGITVTTNTSVLNDLEYALAKGNSPEGMVYGNPAINKADIVESVRDVKLKADMATAVEVEGIKDEYELKNGGYEAEIKDAVKAKIAVSTDLFADRTLAKDTDYEVSNVTDTKTVGDKTVTINAMGQSDKVKGQVVKTFKIIGEKLPNAAINITSNSFVYDGNEKTVTFEVKKTADGDTLSAQTDYEVVDNSDKATKAGKHILKVRGKGNYSFETTKEWDIAQREIEVSADPVISEKIYDGTTTAKVGPITFKDTTSAHNHVNLAVDSDYTAKAEFLDANAGANKKVKVTVTLKKDGNNKFKEDKYEFVKELEDQEIKKAVLTAPAANAAEITYAVDQAHADKFAATIKMSPAAPKVGKYQYQAVKGAPNTANAVGANWKDTNVIGELDDSTKYTFFVRVAPKETEKDNYNESTEAKYEKTLELFKAEKLPTLQVTVEASGANKKVTVKPVEGAQYKFGSDAYSDTNVKDNVTGNDIVVSVKIPKAFPYAEAVATEKVDLTQVTDTSEALKVKVLVDGKYEVDTEHAGKFKVKLKTEPAAVEGRTIQYKKSDSEDWQDSAEFKNIDPGAKLDFYARVKQEAAKGMGLTSDPVTVTFDMLEQAKPELTKTVEAGNTPDKKKITITRKATDTNAEYTFDGGDTWESTGWADNKVSKEFKAEGSVKVGIRLAATATHKVSEANIEEVNLGSGGSSSNGGSSSSGGSSSRGGSSSSSGSSSSGGSSGSGGGVFAPLAPEKINDKNDKTKNDGKKDDKAESVAKDKITPTVNEKGKAEVKVSEDVIKTAIAKAEKKEKVKLEVDIPAGVSSLELNVEKKALESLLASDAKIVEISSSLIKLKLDRKTVETLNEKGDITISAAPTQKLGKRVKKAVGNRPVYDISVKAGDKKITSLGGGVITVSIPYIKSANENKKRLYVAYFTKKGKAVRVKGGSYDKETEMITFKTKSLKKFAVMYKAPKKAKKVKKK